MPKLVSLLRNIWPFMVNLQVNCLIGFFYLNKPLLGFYHHLLVWSPVHPVQCPGQPCPDVQEGNIHLACLGTASWPTPARARETDEEKYSQSIQFTRLLPHIPTSFSAMFPGVHAHTCGPRAGMAGAPGRGEGDQQTSVRSSLLPSRQRHK